MCTIVFIFITWDSKVTSRKSYRTNSKNPNVFSSSKTAFLSCSTHGLRGSRGGPSSNPVTLSISALWILKSVKNMVCCLVAHAENFHGGGSFSGIWWSFAFVVRSLWRHNSTSCSCFQTNVLAKFVDIIGIVFYTHSLYFMCHCTEYKLSELQVRISEENTLNVTTQQFITAKISGCVLKLGSKTHPSLRQSYLQLLNEARLMSCRPPAVEHRKCATGLAGTYSGVQDRILPNYTIIENAHKVRKKLLIFCFVQKSNFLFCIFQFLFCIEANFYCSCPFSLLRHYQMHECFCVKNYCFWSRATVVSCYRNW